MKSITSFTRCRPRRAGQSCYWPSPLRWVTVLALLLAVAPLHAQAPTMERAHDLLTARQFEQAAAMYQQLVEANPDDDAERARANYEWGLSLQRKGKYEQAMQRYAATLASEAADAMLRAEARLETAYCLRIDKQHEEAIKLLRSVMDDPEATPNARAIAGLYCSWSYNNIDQMDQSLAMAHRVTQEAEADKHYRGNAWLTIGRIHADAEQYDKAKQAFESTLTEVQQGTKASAARNELQALELMMQPDMPLFMKPWLIAVTPERATLHWVAKGDVPATATAQDPAVRVASRKVVEIESGFFLFEATFEGMTGGKTYQYSVKGGDAESAGQIITPRPADEPVTFCVLGDTQSRADVHTEIAKRIAEQKPEFVLHAGDCVEKGSNWLEWQTQLIGPGLPYLKMSPLYPARGNHDNGPYFPHLFNLTERQHYSFDHGPIHVVVLDAFGPGAGRAARKVQAQWVDEDLAASDAPWKIALLHDPMVNADLRNHWWGLEEFMPVLEKHGVSVVFSGHHHRYRRFLPLHPPGQPDAGATWHITTGGSGGTLSGMVYSPLTAQTQLIHHFVRVDADPKQLKLKIIDIDGNLIDEFAITNSPAGVAHSSAEAAVDRGVAEKIITFYTHLSPYRDPNTLTPSREGDELVIDFATLSTGPLDTSGYPADATLAIAAAEGCGWDVSAPPVVLHQAKELRFTATPPADNANQPLRVTLTMSLGERELMPHTFNVQVVSAQAALDAE